MKKKVIVVGGGFGGLAAAARLLAAGHEVELFEKRDKLGGRAYVYELDGFKFDGGPTIITAPFMFDDIWAKAGKRREDYFTLVPCRPFYRIFDHRKRAFDYSDDEMAMLEQIHALSPADKRGYLNFVHATKAIFQKGFVELADKPFLSWWDMLKIAPDLLRLQSHKSVYRFVSDFVADDFLRQILSFHPLLVGGNPFDTTSIYALIHYLEREWGVHYALGGTGAIVAAFERLIGELGGKIHLSSEVRRILVDEAGPKWRVQGVELADGAHVYADDVVCNAEAGFTYKRLIEPRYRKKYTDARIDRFDYSMSLFVIYFGTRRLYREAGLVHHNIILGPRYKGLLDDIFRNQGALAEDFSLYLHMPTLTDPSIAPEGHEGFYVLSPVPHLGSGIDWAQHAERYRDAILAFLEANYLPELRKNLVVLHHIDPRHFATTLNSELGSAFSVAPTLRQSAYFRPHNRSEEFDNLYLVGAGTHPGAGLPGVLSSAKIADDLIAAS